MNLSVASGPVEYQSQRSIVTYGPLTPKFAEHLLDLNARAASDAAMARALATDRRSVLVLGAAADPDVSALFSHAGPRVVALFRADEGAAALDALDAGADEIVGEDADEADLNHALFEHTRPGAEIGPSSMPSLADLSAKMAAIAQEIDALLKPADGAEGPLKAVTDPEQAVAPAAPSAAQVRALIRARQARSQYFPVDLFADPAWDMLLDLVAARLEGRVVSVSSLCIASAVPATTALRWIKTMTDAGLLERKPDSSDGRRIFIDLTDRAATAMEAYLARAAAMPGGLMAA